jgi:hypothetical protein
LQAEREIEGKITIMFMLLSQPEIERLNDLRNIFFAKILTKQAACDNMCLQYTNKNIKLGV